MTNFPLDTLRLARRLQEADFPPARAEAQVQVLVELMTLQEVAKRTDT